MTRPRRFIRIASRAALEADPRCPFRVGAAVARGKRLISTGACTIKTHPRNPKLRAKTTRTQACAEFVAIIRALKQLSSLKNCSIYVTRLRKGGLTLTLAKPCSVCQGYMREVGIRNIFFTDQSGDIRRMST